MDGAAARDLADYLEHAGDAQDRAGHQRPAWPSCAGAARRGCTDPA